MQYTQPAPVRTTNNNNYNKLPLAHLTRDRTYDGFVTRVEPYGAFVDIGSIRPGLVHISQQLPSQQLKTIGEQVKVRVVAVDVQNRKITLSCHLQGKHDTSHHHPHYHHHNNYQAKDSGMGSGKTSGYGNGYRSEQRQRHPQETKKIIMDPDEKRQRDKLIEAKYNDAIRNVVEWGVPWQDDKHRGNVVDPHADSDPGDDYPDQEYFETYVSGK